MFLGFVWVLAKSIVECFLGIGVQRMGREVMWSVWWATVEHGNDRGLHISLCDNATLGKMVIFALHYIS